MKWKLLILFSLVLVCSAIKAKKKKKKCGAPSYGSVTRYANGTVSYSCDEGFDLIGRNETSVCDKLARRKNRVAACIPIYVGEVNCTALGNCPNNFNYLKKFDIGDIDVTDEELDEATQLNSRSPGGECYGICRAGFRICQILRKKGKKYRREARKCWKCYNERLCPVVFWG